MFQVLPADLLTRDDPKISTDGADFLLFKEPPTVERYAEIIDELRPQRIVELGIMEGGGTALLQALAQPRRLVAVDRRPPTQPALREYIAQHGLEDVIRAHDDVDQADRPRLAQIVGDAFGDEPIDLVIDDCSHLYTATLASFNELFPRLRSGGSYMIEDWPWAHEQPVADLWAEEIPLTRLIVELVIASGCAQGLISGIAIDADSVVLTRGSQPADPRGFDITVHLDQRGRELLSAPPAAT